MMNGENICLFQKKHPLKLVALRNQQIISTIFMKIRFIYEIWLTLSLQVKLEVN